MAAIGNATALAALDAVVVDTETTGLDPAKAWIVEIGAVRIAGGRLAGDVWRRIPAAHPSQSGRSDPPGGRENSRHRRCGGRAGAAVLRRGFGHIRRARRHGADRPFDRLRSRRAQARVRPRRRGLAAAAYARHAASRRGRRARAGRLFAGEPFGLARRSDGSAAFRAGRRRNHGARVPRARSEAARGGHPHARRSRTGLPRHEPPRWKASIAPAGPIRCRRRAHARPAARIDTYPYRHRVADVMSAPPRFTAPDAPLADALGRMARERVSSLFVHPDGSGRPARPDETGIVTERDVLRALANGGAQALDPPGRRCREPPAAHGSGRRVLLSRHRADEPPRHSPSRRDGRGGLRHRRRVGTRSVAAARRGRDCARR